MADVGLNPVLERFRGAIGNLVFKRFFNRTVVARKAEATHREPSPAQAAVRSRFRLAASYAQAVFANPADKAVYAALAAVRGSPVFSIAMTDYLTPPVVETLDLGGYRGQAGDLVQVEATDDFEVVGVTVAIRNDGGEILEQGPASLVNGRWQYPATVTIAAGETVTVEATAKDRPGHAATKSALVVLEA